MNIGQLRTLATVLLIAFGATPVLSNGRFSEPPSELVSAYPDDSAAQLATVNSFRGLGSALLSWITDMAGSQATTVGVHQFERASRTMLLNILVPAYIDDMPKVDGWGNPIEVYVNMERISDLRLPLVLVRSPGKGGRFESEAYEAGAFASSDFTQDLVWSDGFYVRWPKWVIEGIPQNKARRQAGDGA